MLEFKYYKRKSMSMYEDDMNIMMRPIIIFTVNSISSAKLGSGTISIDMISKTITGIPRLAILVG